VTVNEYLAQRDAGWMAQVYSYLGLSVGVIIPDESFVYDVAFSNDKEDPRFRHLRPATRQEAYAADITYGTNNEYGFDYLRDNMVREVEQLRQRPLHYAIVDEVDSILIDEARTPLIISSSAAASGSSYGMFAKVARQLKPEHYEVDEKRKAVVLTDEGVEYIEKVLSIKNLYDTENIRTILTSRFAPRPCSNATRTTWSRPTGKWSSLMNSPDVCCRADAIMKAFIRPSKPKKASMSRKSP
jgi:preprotein translocase subunit SecA